MKQDTMPIATMERGIRILTHDWRNILQSLSFRILSAASAESDSERATDLQEATNIIRSSTRLLSDLGRKTGQPKLEPIVYPCTLLLEDIALAVPSRLGENASRVQFRSENLTGETQVDYGAFLDALKELFENSLRHLAANETLQVEVTTENVFRLAWEEKQTTEMSPEFWGKTPFLSSDKNRLGLGVFFARNILEGLGGNLTYSYSIADKTLSTRLELPLSAQ